MYVWAVEEDWRGRDLLSLIEALGQRHHEGHMMIRMTLPPGEERERALMDYEGPFIAALSAAAKPLMKLQLSNHGSMEMASSIVTPTSGST
jgi:hypothetical protein